MKKLIHIFVLLFFIGWSNILIGQGTAYMDSLQINAFLQKPGLNKIIDDFYLGKFKVSDNDKTFELLKIITSKNDEFFPIYFNTLNKIVDVADGALAEMITDFCFEMIINYPSQTFNYFITNHDISSKYARSLGYELYYKNEGTSDMKMNFIEFQNYLITKLDLKNKDIDRAYSYFIEEIRTTIKKMD